MLHSCKLLYQLSVSCSLTIVARSLHWPPLGRLEGIGAMNSRALGMVAVATTIVAGCGGHDELFGEPDAHVGSIDGTSVIAVAPDPITTTRLPE